MKAKYVSWELAAPHHTGSLLRAHSFPVPLGSLLSSGHLGTDSSADILMLIPRGRDSVGWTGSKDVVLSGPFHQPIPSTARGT